MDRYLEYSLRNYPHVNDKRSHWWDLISQYYSQISNISCTLIGNKIVGYSDVVGASPVGAAPTTSSFPNLHLASMDWAETNAKRYKNHLNVTILMNFSSLAVPELVKITFPGAATDIFNIIFTKFTSLVHPMLLWKCFHFDNFSSLLAISFSRQQAIYYTCH